MSILNKLRVLLVNTSIARFLNLRYRYPTQKFAPDADIRLSGTLTTGSNVSWGHYLRLNIARGARLEIGERTYVGRLVEISPGPEITIGEYSTIQDKTILLGHIHIGRYALIGQNVYISSGTHVFQNEPELYIRDQEQRVAKDPSSNTPESRPVYIDDDCWIGTNAVILPGVHIGKGGIIGANAVVGQSVAPYSIVMGNPARTIGKRLDFKPSESISCDQPKHYPYFYKGFHYADKDLTLLPATEGLATDMCFAVALGEQPEHTQVILEIRKRTNIPSQIIFANQSKALSSQWSEVGFDLPKVPISQILEFRVSPGSDAVVKRVWLI